MFVLQLYNVVVETEQVGKKLLEKGELKRRVTIIPLNKIAATRISNDAVKRAESLVCLCTRYIRTSDSQGDHSKYRGIYQPSAKLFIFYLLFINYATKAAQQNTWSHKKTHTHTRLTALFWDYPVEPVPER